jgi:hypothetical protein
VRRIPCGIALPRICSMLLVVTTLVGCRRIGHPANNTIAQSGNRPVATGPHTYSTTFPRTEKPISEDGNWIGGSMGGRDTGKLNSTTEGRLWGDVQTVPGLSFGVDEPTEFGDPTAILTGAWGPTQTATAKVRIIKTPKGNCCHEVELRLRANILDRSITGYEAYCSVMPDNRYCHITRWNGPNGSYWNFEKTTRAIYLVDGDVIKATATGSNPVILTLYINNAPIEQAVDTGAAGGGFGAYGPWASGNPGIGFFDNIDSNWNDFGLSSFSVTDDEAAAQPPASAR